MARRPSFVSLVSVPWCRVIRPVRKDSFSMHEDCFGLAMPAASREAVDHYNETLCAFLGYRRDTGAHLKSARSTDPGLFMGYCLRGYFF